MTVWDSESKKHALVIALCVLGFMAAIVCGVGCKIEERKNESSPARVEGCSTRALGFDSPIVGVSCRADIGRECLVCSQSSCRWIDPGDCR